MTVPFLLDYVIAAPGYTYAIQVNMWGFLTESDYENNYHQDTCIG
jgi:hypothetical protein